MSQRWAGSSHAADEQAAAQGKITVTSSHRSFGLQVQTLEQHQGLLLEYASQLAREKNHLMRQTLDLTERSSNCAAENLELRTKLQRMTAAARHCGEDPGQRPYPPSFSSPAGRQIPRSAQR